MKESQTFPADHEPSFLELSLAQVTGRARKTSDKKPDLGRQFSEQPEHKQDS